jgi:hypothetical protein
MRLAATAGCGVEGSFRGSDSTDEFVRSFCVEHLYQVNPVEEVESFDEAGSTVGENGGATQLLDRHGQLDGVLGCLRFGASDPEAPGLIALVSHVLGLVAGQPTRTLICNTPDPAG